MGRVRKSECVDLGTRGGHFSFAATRLLILFLLKCLKFLLKLPHEKSLKRIERGLGDQQRLRVHVHVRLDEIAVYIRVYF